MDFHNLKIFVPEPPDATQWNTAMPVAVPARRWRISCSILAKPLLNRSMRSHNNKFSEGGNSYG